MKLNFFAPCHSAKLNPVDVLWTSLKGVLWTFAYGPQCNTKGRPLPTSEDVVYQCNELRTSPYCPMCNAKERPYRPLEDVLCRNYDGIPRWSNI